MFVTGSRFVADLPLKSLWDSSVGVIGNPDQDSCLSVHASSGGAFEQLPRQRLIGVRVLHHGGDFVDDIFLCLLRREERGNLWWIVDIANEDLPCLDITAFGFVTQLKLYAQFLFGLVIAGSPEKLAGFGIDGHALRRDLQSPFVIFIAIGIDPLRLVFVELSLRCDCGRQRHNAGCIVDVFHL